DEGEELVSMQAAGQRSCRMYSDCEAGFACVRGRCKAEATSFYLGHIENVPENELIDRLLEEPRLFAIIPRNKLARVDSMYRKRFEPENRESLAVLDTRSSRFLLVSNNLDEGETDENYIADLILPSRPSPEYPVRKPVRFTNGLEFLGYDLDPDEVSS